MLKPQKKLTKKELKEDKFVETAMNVQAYVNDNIQRISLIVAVVFIAFALIMYLNYSHDQTVLKSSTILGEAQLEYQNMNYTKARNLLNKLNDEFSGTEAAEQGLFLLANLDYQQEKYEQAAQGYLEFTDSYNGSDILVASGYAGYAACMEKLEKWQEAAEFYKKAQKEAPDFVEASNYLYLAALNAMEVNDFDTAKDLLNKIIEDYKDSQRERDAKAQLILIAQK